MSKQYYIRMPEKLMESEMFNSTEKIFVSFLEVLTDKGTRGTDKSTAFFAKKLGVSKPYVSTMLKKLSNLTIIYISREYGRRIIKLNKKVLTGYGFITKKTIRGKAKTAS